MEVRCPDKGRAMCSNVVDSITVVQTDVAKRCDAAACQGNASERGSGPRSR